MALLDVLLAATLILLVLVAFALIGTVALMVNCAWTDEPYDEQQLAAMAWGLR